MVPKTGRYFSEKSVLNSDTRSRKNSNKKLKVADANEGGDKVDDSQEPIPEVRYEIFYPCASKSSIAHNPKYITTSVGLTESGENHPEGGKLSKTRTKKRRLRLSWKDITELVETYELEKGEDDDMSETEDSNSISTTEEETMSTVEPLNLAQFICGFPVKKSKQYQNISKSCIPKIPPILDLKPRRIVYTDDNAGFDYQPKHKSRDEKDVPYKRYAVQSPLSLPVTVNLPAEQTEPQILQETFGDKYHEANTIQRTFVIDISEKVESFMKMSPFSKSISLQDLDLSSYLILTHNGVCHNGQQEFRVKLNANLNMNTIAINTMYDDDNMSSVLEIIERILAFFCTLPQDTLVTKSSLSYKFTSPKLSFDLVVSANKWNVKGAFPSELQLCSKLTEKRHKNTNAYDEDIDEYITFCPICFEEIDVHGSKSLTATALNTCRHWFCDVCWRTHLLNSINSGSLRIRCPEFKCENIVDIITMASLINIRDIQHLHQHNITMDVQESHNKKWCPYPGCGRVLVTSATTSDITTVPTSMTCGCGTSLCFNCMQTAHWPASCEQTKAYKETIVRQKDYIELMYHDEYFITEVIPFVKVKGKSCPRCSRFIEKDGGCQYMSCPCGVSFCWICLQEWNNHTTEGCKKSVNYNNVKHFFSDAFDRDKDIEISIPLLYNLAVDRRVTRSQGPVNKLRSGSRALARSLNKLAIKDAKTRTLIEEKAASARIHTTVLNELFYIMRRMLTVKLEVDHVIEFTAVSLMDGTMKRKRRKLLLLMSRLGDISREFKTILESGENQNVTKTLPHLFDLQESARMTIAILRKTIQE